MDTNQTIDGVSRRMLTALLCQVSEFHNRALVDELRALLDAPVCKTPSGSACPGDGVGSCNKCQAAQPQGEGEPVAYDPAKENKQFEAWARTQSQVDLRLCDIGLYYERQTGLAHDAWQHREKLAEQPAPVAIVGAKSEGFGQGLSIQDWFVKGYEHPDADKTKCERALFESFCHDGNRLGTSQNHRTDGSYDEIDTQAAWEAWQVRAKMEKQVAVVLPDRKCDRKLGQALMENYRSGWNACLDELKRLNPSL